MYSTSSKTETNDVLSAKVIMETYNAFCHVLGEARMAWGRLCELQIIYFFFFEMENLLHCRVVLEIYVVVSLTTSYFYIINTKLIIASVVYQISGLLGLTKV